MEALSFDEGRESLVFILSLSNKGPFFSKSSLSKGPKNELFILSKGRVSEVP